MPRSIARLYSAPECEIASAVVERVAVKEPEADRLLKLFLSITRDPRDRMRGRFAGGAEPLPNRIPTMGNRPPTSAGSPPPVTMAEPRIDWESAQQQAMERMMRSARKTFR
jgi:hypothetical protein